MPDTLSNQITNNKEVIKLKAKPVPPANKTINSVRCGEFPNIVNYIDQLELILFNTQVNNNHKMLLRYSKEIRKKISFHILNFINQFNLKSIDLYWDELDFDQSKRFFVQYKVSMEKNQAIVHDLKEVPWTLKKPKIEIDNVIEYILQNNIFTPLIIEENSKKEKVINKYFLELVGKGELFNYNKKMIQGFPVKTIFFPVEIGGNIISVFELLLSDKENVDQFVNNFLRTLSKVNNKMIKSIFTLKASNGQSIYRSLLKEVPINKTEFDTMGLIFFDIAEYSKLSLKIHDEELTDEENENLKVELLAVFNYVVSEVLSQFPHFEVDKIVGDMVMVTLSQDNTIDDESERMEELAQRCFIISWNLDIALRTINRRIKEMIEKKGFNILNQEVYEKLMKQSQNKNLKIDVVTYTPRKRDNKPIELSIHLDMLVRYYYILKKYHIDNGLEVRIGINIGSVLKVNLGGIRLDSTVIGKEVDLASRMENLGKKNTIKMPLKVYKLLPDQFKNFVVSYIGKENNLSSNELTFQMVFQTKRENPKGSKPIGTVEFHSNLGHIYKSAQKHYDYLVNKFKDYDQDNIHDRYQHYIVNNKDKLIASFKASNPKLKNEDDNTVFKLFKNNTSFQNNIRNAIIADIDKSISIYLDEVRNDKAVFRVVRNLMMNKNEELFKKFFIDKSRMSEGAKFKYFQERFVDTIRKKTDFKLLSKSDLDIMITDFLNKIYGKASD